MLKSFLLHKTALQLVANIGSLFKWRAIIELSHVLKPQKVSQYPIDLIGFFSLKYGTFSRVIFESSISTFIQPPILMRLS